MAQQRRSKKKEEVNWVKIGAVGFAVLLAFMMALSLVGTAWIGGLRSIEPGDLVVLDYTVYAKEGVPVLTSSEAVASQAEGFVYLSGPIENNTGYVPDDSMLPIPDRHNTLAPFALLSSEFREIVEAPIGHRERDRITVPFTFESRDDPLEMAMTSDDVEKMGYEFDDLLVGEMIVLGFVESPEILVDDAESKSMLRIAYVKEKTDDMVLVRYGYEYAVVTINSVRALS
ncbi:hypothetical protein [Methanocalculus natronophilus]|uniref:hypothetical protein n=1 Tax=Methanocalculus natronophilus TaxID=1262400 RepID=UPI0031B5CBD2